MAAQGGCRPVLVRCKNYCCSQRAVNEAGHGTASTLLHCNKMVNRAKELCVIPPQAKGYFRVFRYAAKSACWFLLVMPAKNILVPGTMRPGPADHLIRLSSVQTILEAFSGPE